MLFIEQMRTPDQVDLVVVVESADHGFEERLARLINRSFGQLLSDSFEKNLVGPVVVFGQHRSRLGCKHSEQLSDCLEFSSRDSMRLAIVHIFIT